MYKICSVGRFVSLFILRLLLLRLLKICWLLCFNRNRQSALFSWWKRPRAHRFWLLYQWDSEENLKLKIWNSNLKLRFSENTLIRREALALTFLFFPSPACYFTWLVESRSNLLKYKQPTYLLFLFLFPSQI